MPLTHAPSIQRKRRQRGNGGENVERRDREQEAYKDPAEHGCLHRFDGSNLLILAATRCAISHTAPARVSEALLPVLSDDNASSGQGLMLRSNLVDL